MEKIEVLVTIPNGPLKAHLFTEKTLSKLQNLAHVTWNPLSRDYTEHELAQAIKDKTACITGWGTHKFAKFVLKQANKLRFVGHMAGSLSPLVDEDFFSRGITITNANIALAYCVAEYCLLMALLTSWNMLSTIAKVKGGLWPGNNDIVDGLNGKTIGLIGYGAVAERFVRLLTPFDVRIYVCSEHCPAEKAQEFGFKLTSLEKVLTCDIISVHHTLTDRTYHMLDAEKLQLIPDGSIFMNTARGAICDEQALMHELKKNRFTAVLDVFEQEPLPQNHLFSRLPNVIVTPHCAATSVYWRHKLPEVVITDMELFFRGKEPKHLITLEKYKMMTIF